MFSSALKFALLSASAVSAFVLPVARQAPNATLGLSPACYNAGAALLTSPIAQCYNVKGFLDLLLTPMDKSWVGPIDTWLTGMCPQKACDTKDLVAAYDTFTTGCHAEFLALGWTDEMIQAGKAYIPKYYALEREIECLKDPDGSSAFCVTKLLTEAERLIGVPLSPVTAETHLPGLFATGYPKTLLCTSCTKAYYTIAKREGWFTPADDAAFIKVWKTECGTDLV